MFCVRNTSIRGLNLIKRSGKFSTKKLIKFLHGKGYRIWDTKGSHYILTNTQVQLQIPLRKELGQKTLRDSLERAGFTLDQFIEEVK